MTRPTFRSPLLPASSRCGAARRLPRRRRAHRARRPPTPEPAPVAVRDAAVESRPIDRYLRVTGSLAGRRAGRGQRRDRRPRRRDAGRARDARPAGHACSCASRRPRPPRSCRRPRPTRRRSRRGSASRPASRSTPKQVPDVHEREGVARLGRGGVQPHQVAARSEGRLAERVRPAADAGRGGAPAVPGRAERRRSSRTARSRPRARASTLARKSVADTDVRAPFAGIVAERARQHRRLRHARHQGRDGRPHRSAPRRADGARAVRLAGQSRASR